MSELQGTQDRGRRNIPTSRGIGRYDDNMFSKLESSFNRLADDFFGNGWNPLSTSSVPPWESQQFLPRIDVSELDDKIQIIAEIPGVAEEDIEVSVDRNGLTIRGEKRQETKDERDGRFYHERSFGSFMRTIPLPQEVDRDQVEASYDKGVLNITVPKLAEAREQRRRINIGSRPQQNLPGGKPQH